jgi:hypothetical protein
MSVDGAKELKAMTTALTALEPLDEEARARALNWLAEALGVGGALRGKKSSFVGGLNHAHDIDIDDSNISEMTPKQFMSLKRATTDVERIACLAYYLTYARDTLHFKTTDLTSLNTEAAGLRFGNASQAASNAMNQNGYIAQAGKGNRQITPRGEAVVEALPDREAVAAALAEHPKRARRKKAAAKTAKS